MIISSNHKQLAPFLFLCVSLNFSLFSTSYASNKALLIGTGSYNNPAFNLTGIDLDLSTMTNFARKIGFQPEEIRSLSNDQVTHENVKSAFANFLAKDTRKEDTILIYYSGHGVQVADKNGDEPDKRDEALTLYNLAETSDGYDGLLLDDDIAELLATLPSENVIMIIDACHSGTATRSIGAPVPMQTQAYGPGEFQSKALPYRGAKDSADRSLSITETKVDNPLKGVVTMSAAQDDEQALATRRGSTFTLALSEALELTGHKFTPESLVNVASGLIRERIDKQKLFRPNLTGDSELFNKDLTITAAAETELVNWNGILDTVSGVSDLEATLSSSDYLADELINLRIHAPENGYINIIAVDKDDSLILLYPNQYNPDNRVQEGLIELPGKREFEWAAQGPWGENVLVALFTREKVNLFESSLQKNQAGVSTAEYALPSLKALRELGYGAELSAPAGTAGTALFFNTCESQQGCN